MSVMDQTPETAVDTDERARQTVEALQEAQAIENPAIAAQPEATTEVPEPTTGELTKQFEMPAVPAEERNARPDAVTNPVTNSNVLDLRDKKRAEETADAKARLEKLQAAEDNGTLVYKDGQKPTTAAAPTPEATTSAQAPAGEKKSWFKRLLGR